MTRLAMVSLLVFLTGCWFAPVLWTSQSDPPLSLEELRQLVQQYHQGKLSEDRVLYIIAERKVGLSFDQSVRKSLKQLGASRLILEAVAAHGRVSGRAPQLKDEPARDSSPSEPRSHPGEAGQATDPYKLSVDVDLVNINVVVTDASGRYLTHLQKENFRVYEDKVEQQITHFSPVDAPFALGLLLDTSYSTINKLGQIQDEAIRFVREIHIDDEVMIISFDDEVHLDSDFTRNKQATERAIKRTRTGRATQLYEAVYLALQQKIRHKRQRKAVVLFTDGVDTASRTSSAKETIELAKEADTLIYPIFFDTRYDLDQLSRNPLPPTGTGGGTIGFPLPLPRRAPPGYPGGRRQDRDFQMGRKYLERLAKVTGGSLYVSRGLQNLGDAFRQIAAELRSQYSLAYSPTNDQKDGKFRRVRVVTNLADATVRAKGGYYNQ